MKLNKHNCECHKKIGKSVTCNMECFKCSGAREVITRKDKEGKTVKTIIF